MIDFQRLLLGLKWMKLWLVAPVIIVYVFLVSVQKCIVENLGFDRFGNIAFFNMAQIVLPIILTLWPALFFRQLTDPDVSEIIYAYDRRNKLRFIVYLIILQNVLLVPLFFWYSTLYSNYGAEILRLMLQTIALASLFFAICYISGSSLTAFGLTFIFASTQLFYLEGKGSINLFQLQNTAEETPITAILFHSALALTCLLIGSIAEKHYGSR